MRRAVAGILCLALATGIAPVAGAEEAKPPSAAEAMAAVVPYASTWDGVGRDIASLTVFTDGLADAKQRYTAWRSVLRAAASSVQAQVAGLAGRVEQLQAQEAQTAGALAEAQARAAEQERIVGGLARLLYQQPSPELHAIEQFLEGEDLRSLDRQDLVTDVLQSKTAELEATEQQVAALQQQLDATRNDLSSAGSELTAARQQQEGIAGRLGVVDASLAAIDTDQQRARQVIDQIRAEEEARLRAQAEAAARAAAAAAAAEAAEAAAAAAAAAGSQPQAGGGGSGATPAKPTGGGVPAVSTEKFSALLPASVPYRDVFLTYGIRYRVEPALLAAIASQESGFNPSAGCNRSGAGKGIMQHENQPQYCGPDAVEASVEKAAIMLASYYNRTKSWTAAVFAFNNGPGLMGKWVQFGGDKDRLLQELSNYYNAQSYARPGPMGGYGSWGEWRARVAYSYAAPTPEPGFHSATQKWLIYRQG